MVMSKQGKGTADHILPLGDWFLGSGPGGYRRGRSPVEYRGNLSIRTYVCSYVRPSIPPQGSSEAAQGSSEAGQGLPEAG